MSTSSRLRRATTLVPLAVLSAAWTASLAGANLSAASADEDGPGTLPDGTVLPASAIEAPASVGDAVTRAAALTPGSASSIPQAALSAYQRAEAVINKADRGCALPWELIAAIGRVESDHGRYGGNTLDDQGVARPGIYGIASQRQEQHPEHRRHRRRAVRRRHQVGPRGRPDAVHPLDLVGRRRGRRQRRHPQPAGHRRRGPRDRRLPLLRRRRPVRGEGPARRRSTATTTPTTTSTWCCRSCSPTWTATSARSRPRSSPRA